MSVNQIHRICTKRNQSMKMGIKGVLAICTVFAASSINFLLVEALPTYSDHKGHKDRLNLSDRLIDCSNAEDGAKFPSPLNCSEFYECDNGIAYQFECPEKHGDDGYERLFFDPELQVCNWPSVIDCEVDNNNSSLATRMIELNDIEQNDDTEPIDDFDCSDAEDGAQFPSPTNCSEYYVCVSRLAYLRKCPMMVSGGSLYYDPEIKICNWPNLVECEITSTTSPATTSIVTEPAASTTTPDEPTTSQVPLTTTQPRNSSTTSIETTVQPESTETIQI